MDKITESLLNEFSSEHDIASLSESKRFEHFACFITVKHDHGETFESEDIVTGAGGDIGIDGIAILVNGSLITDAEELEEQLGNSGHLDATFVFIQSTTTSGFEAAKIGSFGFGVQDFFKDKPSQQRNEKITALAEVWAAIYKRSSRFKRGNPVCKLYYVTTGKWQGDQTLEARRQAVVVDLQNTGLFREVEFEPIGAEGLQKLYRQTKNAISREFTFDKKIAVPQAPGVTQAYLGFLPVTEFLKLIKDDNGEIVPSLFYDNVRDWQKYNEVNTEIRTTLESNAKARFVLMNNGITIIARTLQPTGDKFYIEDFQIVNGCQTSHVLFDNIDKIDASVTVPVRLIGTQDESVINAIIRATNRQTEVTEEQFFSLEEFPKSLEAFFQAFPDQQKLYYERRSRQYDRLQIERTRIITPTNMIRAFAAMFLNEPHRTTRNYSALSAKVGKEIFAKNQKMEPYYTAAYALYRLEYLFRSGRIERHFKAARFHILYAARIGEYSEQLPPMNSHDMGRYCEEIMKRLWDSSRQDELILIGAQIVDRAARGDFQRDNIRTEPFTQRVLAEARSRKSGTDTGLFT